MGRVFFIENPTESAQGRENKVTAIGRCTMQGARAVTLSVSHRRNLAAIVKLDDQRPIHILDNIDGTADKAL
jgi:hypothetical protein